MSIQAMKQALEAMTDVAWDEEGYCMNPDLAEAADALRAAIEAQEHCEPVAWRWSERGFWFSWTTDFTHHGKALRLNCPVEYAYAHPAAEVGKGPK